MYSFELHRQVDAVQMSTHNIYFYKEELKKKYTGCNLNSMEFIDWALIGVCAVIRLNAVVQFLFSCFLGIIVLLLISRKIKFRLI